VRPCSLGFVGVWQLRHGGADPGLQGDGRSAAQGGGLEAPVSAACMPARKFGFEETSTDTAAVLADPASMRW
jgi:hypothetical protein